MRMAVLLRKDGIAFMLLAFCAMLPTCSAQAVSDTDCDPANNDATSGESAVCKAKDVNAECPANTKKCACKDGYKVGSPESNTCVLKVVTETTCDSTNNDVTAGGAAVCKDVDANAVCPVGASECACKEKYKEGNPERNKCVLKEISDFSCDPSNDDGATGGAAVCKAVNTNAECPHGETRCKCKSGYKQDETVVNTCVKVITGACATNVDCTGTVASSECSARVCSCVPGYKETNNICVKVLGGPCDTTSDCTGSVANSVCLEKKCDCKANFIEESDVCKTAIGQTCAVKGDCVTNAECDQKCKCSSGFTNTDGLCAAESSATSAWMTSNLIATSMLIYLPRFICW